MTFRVVWFVLLSVVSWTVMTTTHEAGHLLGGWLCGGTLQAADLRPWRLPYSIFNPDPRPLVTLWCGPLVGVIAPGGLATLLRRSWTRFVANFCLLANGAYLATAWLSGDPHLDTPKLLEHGASPLSIGVYCVLTIGWGYVGFRRSCREALAPSPETTIAPKTR